MSKKVIFENCKVTLEKGHSDNYEFLYITIESDNELIHEIIHRSYD